MYSQELSRGRYHDNRKFFMVTIAVIIYISSYVQAKSLPSYRNRRNAVRDRGDLWPQGIVVYKIQGNFTTGQLILIKKAMNDISSVSCIRFKERTKETAYVRFIIDDGCWSNIGYLGVPQKLSLGRGCYRMRTVVHEILHTLGFYHEHTRPDRDNYVSVEEENIKPEEIYNFNKKSFDVVTTLGLPYDINSVLHYHDRSFAVDRKKKTLKSTHGEGDVKEALEMSLLDIMRLNLLYRCLR